MRPHGYVVHHEPGELATFECEVDERGFRSEGVQEKQQRSATFELVMVLLFDIVTVLSDFPFHARVVSAVHSRIDISFPAPNARPSAVNDTRAGSVDSSFKLHASNTPPRVSETRV